MAASEFRERVYRLARKIPSGKITTYGHLAKKLKTSPRAVGNAMAHNPYAPIVPCHRVVAAGGFIGGFAGKWGKGPTIKRKIAMLKQEGVTVTAGRVADFAKVLYKPS
jgi:methylated-DNA-[protein]-cysteine S-methyltransferase